MAAISEIQNHFATRRHHRIFIGALTTEIEIFCNKRSKQRKYFLKIASPVFQRLSKLAENVTSCTSPHITKSSSDFESLFSSKKKFFSTINL